MRAKGAVAGSAVGWRMLFAALAAMLLATLGPADAFAQADESKQADEEEIEGEFEVPTEERGDLGEREALTEQAAKKQGVEEIVVTGRKREELLQQVPISIRAFTSTEIEQRDMTRLDDIGRATANLKFDTTTGSNRDARIYIRGVGQDNPSSLLDPGVGVYLDGVYLPRLNQGLLDLVDIERIEVLRGPQGTLFGKNTVGGVINVISQKPGPDYAAKGQFRVGNFGLFQTRLSADVPVRIGPFTDKLFTRFSFASNTDDGYLTNLVDGSNAGDNKLLAARVALMALPTDDLTIDFIFDWSTSPQRPNVGECRETNPFNLGRLVVDNFTRFREECGQTTLVGRDLKGFALGMNKTTVDVYGLNLTPTWQINENWELKFITSWRRRNSDDRGGDLDGTPTQFLGSAAGSSDHNAISDEFTLTGTALDGQLNLVTGLYFFWEHGESTGVGEILRPFTPETSNIQTCPPGTEFDPNDPWCILPSDDPFFYLSPAGQTPFGPRFTFPVDFAVFDSIVAGAFCQLETAQMDPMICAPDGMGGFNPVPPDPFQRGIADLNNSTFTEFTNLSYAWYGQASFTLAPDPEPGTWGAVEVTGGLRYTREVKDRSGVLDPIFPCGYQTELVNGACPVAPGTPLSGGVTYQRDPEVGIPQTWRTGAWTPKVQLAWQATDDIFAYALWARGFKSGGFDESIITQDELIDRIEGGTSEFLEFSDEKSDTYEAGLKTQWFDRRLTVNATGYLNLYKDIQLTRIGVDVNGILNSSIRNAGQGNIHGFELEIAGLIDPEWLPGPDARILFSGGVGLTAASFSSFTTGQLIPASVTPDCTIAANQADPRLCTLTAAGTYSPRVIEVSEMCSSLKFSDCVPGGVDQPATLGPNNTYIDDGGVPFEISTRSSQDPNDPGFNTINTSALAPGGVNSMTQIIGSLIAPEAQIVDKSGLDFKNTPKWNFNLSATYQIDLFERGTLGLRFNYYWQSMVWYNTDNTVGQGAYGLLDGRLSFDGNLWGGVTVAAWVKNLLDRRYLNGGVALGEGIGIDGAFWGRPRSYGMEFQIRY